MFKRTVTLSASTMAKLLKDIRTSRQLSVNQLAEKLVRPPEEVLKAENGEPDTVSLDLLLDYALHLNLNLNLVVSSHPV